MSPMSMTVKAAREALDAAKRDDAFVNRYLDGDREAFATMQQLMRAAYPDEGPGEARGGADDSAFGSAMTAAPMGDGGGGAMPEWLLEAGDAGFARPKSPAYYNFEYAPHVEIDPEFDRLARDWMYQAELPAGWSSEIARDYQRRAAKPPSDVELAEERAAVLGRLRQQWGEATDAKLAQVRELVHGIGDDRLIETLNRSGLGNNEWLIRQLAIHADRKAVKAVEREKAQKDTEKPRETETRDEADSPYRDIAHRPSGVTERHDADSPADANAAAGSFVDIADRSDSGAQLAEDSAATSPGRTTTQMPFSYPDIPLTAGSGAAGGQSAATTKRPIVNLGRDRQQSVITRTPATFEIADNPQARGDAPYYASHKIGRDEVNRFSKIADEEALAQGVDPDLVKAIMYVENAQGHYFGLSALAERVGKAGSLFPMNIRPDPWTGLGFTESDFKDPRLNIRAAVTLIKRIIERVENPTVAKIATLYNNLRAEHVTDYGARIASVYQQRAWSRSELPRWHQPSQLENVPSGSAPYP